MMTTEHYYAHPRVRERMVEFLGGRSPETATAMYLTATPTSSEVQFAPRPVAELWTLWEQGFELSRSLWDRESLIAHLDIEYVNFDYPAEPYLAPERSYELQAPVVRAIQEELLTHGIAPLHLLSGRGHHFVWRVPRSSRAFGELVAINGLPDTLAAAYAVPRPPQDQAVGTAAGAAFVGLGRLLEYVAHRVLEVAQRECEIPIELTAVEGNGGKRGREIVSIDLSEYADPIHARTIRIPFSAYHKPLQQRAILGEHVVDDLPPLFMIPLFEMDCQQGHAVMRDPLQVVELARYASVQIPDQSEGVLRLIEAYQASPLARFHGWFYSAEHDRPYRWPDTYDRTPLDSLPACVAKILECPNELLLKPIGLRHAVRALLAIGWHPRHIGGLIRSKYERDYGWGDKFFEFDAAARADFWARLFAGLAIAGPDCLSGFHCQAAWLQYMNAPTPHDEDDCNRWIGEMRQAIWAKRSEVLG